MRGGASSHVLRKYGTRILSVAWWQGSAEDGVSDGRWGYPAYPKILPICLRATCKQVLIQIRVGG